MPAAANDPQDWIRAYAGIQKLADRDILKALADAERDLKRQIDRILARHPVGHVSRSVGDFVRVSQLREIRQEMLREQARIFGSLGDVINEQKARAALAAIRLNNRLDAQLFGMVGDQATAFALANSLEQQLTRTVDVVTSRLTQSRTDLSQKIYNNTVRQGGQIDRMINSALLRGLSAREFAAQALSFFSPNTPGGERYAAMRLARTEINNAFHAMSVEAADKPWVTGMQWHLSRSHPKADDCDTLAHEDGFKMGPGVYPVRDVPRKPHPQCLCYVTPKVVGDDEFIDGLFSGKYDGYLHSHGVSRGQERLLSSVPATPKPIISPPTPKAKTPAQLLAAERRKAVAHAKSVIAMPAGVGRDKVLKELTSQAKTTPRSMQKLRLVRGEGRPSQYAREWDLGESLNTGAVYRYQVREMRLSPKLVDDPAGYASAFDARTSNGWFSHSDGGGLESTIAHEYGHHIDFLISDAGTYSPAMGDRLFPVLIKELGLTNAHVGTQFPFWEAGTTTHWTVFDSLVSRNKSKIASRVSKYGSTNGREMLAEIWHEYTTAKNPRPYILRIGQMMQRLAEERAT